MIYFYLYIFVLQTSVRLIPLFRPSLCQ